MSSTHIQLERDSVVSVHTQSMTARSSTRKGTRRNLGAHGDRAVVQQHPRVPGAPCGPVPYPWKRKRLRWLYFLVRKLPRMRVG